jgi:hypothetical protein
MTASTTHEKTGFFVKPASINPNDEYTLDSLHAGKACLNQAEYCTSSCEVCKHFLRLSIAQSLDRLALSA